MREDDYTALISLIDVLLAITVEKSVSEVLLKIRKVFVVNMSKLKEDKILEQEPCEDCISRQAVLDTLDTADKFLDEDRTVERYKTILTEAYEVLPSVKPQERKGQR